MDAIRVKVVNSNTYDSEPIINEYEGLLIAFTSDGEFDKGIVKRDNGTFVGVPLGNLREKKD